MKKTILGILVLIVLIGGYFYLSDNLVNIPNETDKENNLTTEEVVKNKSKEVITALNSGDIENFKKLIHPNKGVRFSKNGLVHPEDKRFTSSEIDNLIKTNETILWGYMDGSGKPINKTFNVYISQYSEVDYLKASQVAFNEVLRGGSSGDNNLKEEYPNTPFMSYHYPHTSTYTNDSGEEVIQPMSWTTLNLVFEEYQREYYLIGIVTDNWTI